MLRQATAFVAALGLIGALALPAYAGSGDVPDGVGENEIRTLAVGARGLDIVDGQAPALKERATVTGMPEKPTPENLAAVYRLSGGMISWPLDDDYYLRDSGNGYAMSPMGYGIRTCTDFVAWRLNRDAGSFGAPWLMPWGYLTPTGGEAQDWADAWAANGWAASTTPVVGAVAWFGYGANHVAYVQAVNGDGTITIEEYNWTPLTYGARTIAADSIPLYLYPPPRP